MLHTGPAQREGGLLAPEDEGDAAHGAGASWGSACSGAGGGAGLGGRYWGTSADMLANAMWGASRGRGPLATLNSRAIGFVV